MSLGRHRQLLPTRVQDKEQAGWGASGGGRSSAEGKEEKERGAEASASSTQGFPPSVDFDWREI